MNRVLNVNYLEEYYFGLHISAFENLINLEIQCFFFFVNCEISKTNEPLQLGCS